MKSFVAPSPAGALAIAALLSAIPAGRAFAQEAPRPALVVVVAVDQMRGDFVDRFRPHYGEEGIGRMLREGFNYSNCHYEHAATMTGAGHATMMTGSYGHRNGIVANDWWQVDQWREMYCAEDVDARTVTNEGVQAGDGETWPPQPGLPAAAGKATSRSPRNLKSETVGDMLEAATAGRAKTVSISWKDRSSIFMAGKSGDVVLWFDDKLGQFVSSTWYGDQLPEWVAAFNLSGAAARWAGGSWNLLLGGIDPYLALCTADDAPGEGKGPFAGITFPHKMGETDSADASYYGALSFSPFANEVIVDLALEAIREEKLGADDVPDILTLSFSANDLVGHAFGPDSWEVMDITLRTDATLARLMSQLDAQVGEGRWTLLLTADHGVAPMPEVMLPRRVPAGRVSSGAMARDIEAELVKALATPPEGNSTHLEKISWPWLVLNLPQDPEARDKALRAASAAAAALPYVAMAMPVEDLLKLDPSSDATIRALQLSYHPERAGQVAFVFKPYYYFGGTTGSTHGSPYRYDQHVPMLAVGAGIHQGVSFRQVSPPMIAPTVAALLGVLQPSLCEVEPLWAALGG